METMMLRLAENTARSDAILAQLRTMDGRSGGSKTASAAPVPSLHDNLEPRILALDEKVSLIGSKLNVLSYQLDSNSLLWAGLSSQGTAGSHNDTGRNADDFTGAGSAPVRAFVNAPNRADRRSDRSSVSADQQQWASGRRIDGGTKEDQDGSSGGESVRTTMASMDRHLKILIELFSEQMDKMMSAVGDVKTAVVAQAESDTTPTVRTTSSSNSANNAKLDAMIQKMNPLLDVSEKVDQVWNVLMGAKTSVDALVPTSEALLWQTQRQERALTEIHTELNVKAKQIIDNLNQVNTPFQRCAKYIRKKICIDRCIINLS